MAAGWLARIAAAVAFASALSCGCVALANVQSLEDALAAQFAPSGAPDLLAAITSAGRKGWDCKPERAASAVASADAVLPQ
jgi:hypothetical protein